MGKRGSAAQEVEARADHGPVARWPLLATFQGRCPCSEAAVGSRMEKRKQGAQQRWQEVG